MAVAEALERVAASESVSTRDSCRLAQVSYADARREQTRWQMLVFVMGCAIGISLIAGIVLVALGSDTRGAGIVAFVGTAVSGAAMAWIVKQRNDGSVEKEKALKLVRDYCEEPEKTVKALEHGADPAQLVVPGDGPSVASRAG